MVVKTKFILAGRRRHDRRAARRKLGPFQDLIIARHTLDRYNRAVREFFHWTLRKDIDISCETAIRNAAVRYLEGGWADVDPLSLAGDTLSGISHFLPDMKPALKDAWRYYGAWRNKEIPTRAPPMLEYIVEAMAHNTFSSGKVQLAFILLLSFDIFLRPSEALGIRALDISFEKDCQSMVINLGYTKAGQRKGQKEIVTCRNQQLCVLAKMIVKDLAPGEYIYKKVMYHYRSEFYQVLKNIGLDEMNFKPYSLRRGGATAAFRKGASWEQIAEIGRWSAHPTMRIYIVDAMAELTSFDVPAHVELSIRRAAKALRQLIAS